MAFVTVMMKDLRLEVRTKESFFSMVVFAVAIILLFAFAFDSSPTLLASFAPGLMWLTFFFAAVLGLLRSFGRENELESFTMLLTAPLDRADIYLGKMLSFSLVLFVAQLVSLPFFMLLLEMPLLNAPFYLLLIIIITDLAIAAVGVLIAAMALRSPSGDALLPILLFPILTPILIAATKATSLSLSQRPIGDWDFWLMLLASFVVLFTLTGMFIFDYISEQ